MNAMDLMDCKSDKTVLQLSHQCKAENGIESWDDDVWTIKELKGWDAGDENYEQAIIVNQYGRELTINVNQIENEGLNSW